ncbi:MAG TPA: hypothetical protein VI893_07960 [Thermoplasmata archaeon]|nr:hypothetical protein [Thermoplasmata archaeon]
MAVVSICHRCGVHIFEPLARCPNCGTDVSPPAPIPESIAQPVRVTHSGESRLGYPSATAGLPVTDDETGIPDAGHSPESVNLSRTAAELEDAAAWVRQVEDSLKLGHQSLSTLREALEREISRLRPLVERADADLARIADENHKLEEAKADLEQRWSKLKQKEDELRRRTGEVFKREGAAVQTDKDLAGKREELQVAQSEIVGRLAKVAQAEKEMHAKLEAHQEDRKRSEEALADRVKELETELKHAQAAKRESERDEKRAAAANSAAEKAALEKRKADLDEREKKLASWDEKVKKARDSLKSDKEKPTKEK